MPALPLMIRDVRRADSRRARADSRPRCGAVGVCAIAAARPRLCFGSRPLDRATFEPSPEQAAEVGSRARPPAVARSHRAREPAAARRHVPRCLADQRRTAQDFAHSREEAPRASRPHRNEAREAPTTRRRAIVGGLSNSPQRRATVRRRVALRNGDGAFRHRLRSCVRDRRCRFTVRWQPAPSH